MFLEFFPLPFFTSLLVLVLVMIRFREEDWYRRTGCTLFGFYLFGGRFLKILYGKRLVFGALVAGLILEGVQLLQKLIFGVSLHSVDINDVIFNALGVIAGGGLFWIAESVFYRARKTG